MMCAWSSRRRCQPGVSDCSSTRLLWTARAAGIAYRTKQRRRWASCARSWPRPSAKRPSSASTAWT
eukprot:4553794-Alexandrium_andersonii.AAC.1